MSLMYPSYKLVFLSLIVGILASIVYHDILIWRAEPFSFKSYSLESDFGDPLAIVEKVKVELNKENVAKIKPFLGNISYPVNSFGSSYRSILRNTADAESLVIEALEAVKPIATPRAFSSRLLRLVYKPLSPEKEKMLIYRAIVDLESALELYEVARKESAKMIRQLKEINQKTNELISDKTIVNSNHIDFVNMLSEEVVRLQTVASQFENTIESLKNNVEFETGFLKDTYSRGFGSEEEEGEDAKSLDAINIGQNVRKFLDNTLKKVHDTVDQHRNNLVRLI